MYELTCSELDAVAAGANISGQNGLINASVQVENALNNNLNNNNVDVSILNNARINVGLPAIVIL